MVTKQGWLFATTPLATVLKARPHSMALFERLRINPWKALHRGIGDVCESHGVSWEAFSEALEKLEPMDRTSDWKSLPIYCLLDYLSAEHREFLQDFIPAIGRSLSQDLSGDPDSLERLGMLVEEWPGFVSTLTEHIREEEDVLFLRILRYDSNLRLGWADPDFEGGSVRVFSTIRLLNQEHRDLKLMKAFLDRVQPVYPGRAEPCALEAALRPLLARFQARLGEHARLESEVLLPTAIAMEKKLYDQSIQGAQRSLTQGGVSRRTFPASAAL